MEFADFTKRTEVLMGHANARPTFHGRCLTRMQPRSKVELFAAIRRDARMEKLSIHELSRRYGAHRRMVREALTSPWPAERKAMPPRRSVVDQYKPVIDAILRADLDAPRKQRHTAERIFDRLVAEHGMDNVSYGRIRCYVKRRKPEIVVEEGRWPPPVFVAQNHRPGEEAEVDFGDVYIMLGGVRTLCCPFAFRLSFSGKAIHRVFLSQAQEAFFEGHVHAFQQLGGVPRGKVRYDNLSSAVAQVLGFTRARVETDRWTAFRSWAGLEVFYCRPGIDGAHEKGGVEGEVGRFRRNRLVPVPVVATLEELNAQIDLCEQRRIGERARTVGEYFAI
ncbi:MAG: IS21 family transposase [Streptomyces sp.]|nr:IS21 family transposase [Streptomyces sp.]